MNYLTQYYKNLSEQLQEQVNHLEKLLEAYPGGMTPGREEVLNRAARGRYSRNATPADMQKSHKAEALLRRGRETDTKKANQEREAMETAVSSMPDFHNKIVNGIKSLKRRKAKAESPFKEGDIVKADYEGRTYFGVYDGIDKHGRIKAKGHRVKLSFGLDRYTLATPEEERAYKNEGIMIEKRRIESNIKRIKMLLSMGSAKPSDLEEILRRYKSKFGEEYEG